MTSALMTTSAFAEWVYVTKNGKKYHHAESRFSQVEGAEKLTKEEAQERGYEPSRDYLKMVERLEQQNGKQLKEPTSKLKEKKSKE